jgi:DNA-binding MarR family transcriptional regulator
MADGAGGCGRVAELETESRRYLAAYVLFNQAVADKPGMHPTDLQCLSLITIEEGPFTTGQIAELTGLTSGSASRLVDRLVKAGYVTRQRDTSDRRRVLVQPVLQAVQRVGEVRRTTQLGRAQAQRLRG